MSVSLRLAVESYHCIPCHEKRGLLVQALVRMIPRSAVMDGALVGDEYWCCPICHRPKFDLKRKPFQVSSKSKTKT